MRSVRVGPLIGLVAQVALLAVLAGTVGLSSSGWVVGLACGVVTYALPRRRAWTAPVAGGSARPTA